MVKQDDTTSAATAESRELKIVVLTLVGTWVALAGFAVVLLPAFGYQVDLRHALISAMLTAVLVFGFWYFGKGTILFNRIILTLAGSSKVDFVVDLGRLVAVIGLVIIPLSTHGWGLFSTKLGILYVFIICALLITVLYPYLRRPTKWDVEYNRRKVMMTAAINSAALFFVNGRQQSSITHMEDDILRAIKSYLEYSVLDLDGNNINVNLIVPDPQNDKQLVCINRATEGEVPKYYPLPQMTTAMKAIEERKPVYNGNFVSRLENPKPYKTIWHIPICFPPGEKTECIGLLAFDSRKRRHFDVSDGREALLFNLSPYIALLRYALLLRRRYNYWD